MKLQIPFGIAEAFFIPRMLLNVHQFHDVLLGNLRSSKFSDIAFNQLTSLKQLERTIIGEFKRFVGGLLVTGWFEMT